MSQEKTQSSPLSLSQENDTVQETDISPSSENEERPDSSSSAPAIETPSEAPSLSDSSTEEEKNPSPKDDTDPSQSLPAESDSVQSVEDAVIGNTPPPPPDSPKLFEENTPSPHPSDADTDSTDREDPPMSLMDHLQELRKCLTRACIAVFLGFIACWVVVDPIFNTLVDPLLHALPKGSHAIYTTLPEGFFTRMYIAFVAGVFVTSPVIFYQIWSFIAPALYEEEKRYIIPIAFLSALFFMGGGFFCFKIVFPYAFSFFVSFATEEIVAMPKVSDYLNFVLKLLLAFGLIFEMPLFSFFLSRMGLITADSMRKVRRYAVLVIFIVAAILTPPDVVSQLLMAGPMLILYEVSIAICAIFGKKKRERKKEKKENEEKEEEEEEEENPYIPKENN